MKTVTNAHLATAVRRVLQLFNCPREMLVHVAGLVSSATNAHLACRAICVCRPLLSYIPSGRGTVTNISQRLRLSNLALELLATI